MQQKFESKFGFYSVLLIILTFAALSFCYLILVLVLVPVFSSSFSQIGNWFGLISILGFLGFVFYKFLTFLFSKEIVELKEDSILINNNKKQVEIKWRDINWISEVYHTRQVFSLKMYRVELDTKLGIFYIPPKIMSNLGYVSIIRKFFKSKKELQNKLNLDEVMWQTNKIGGYIAFISLGFLLILFLFGYIWSIFNR